MGYKLKRKLKYFIARVSKKMIKKNILCQKQFVWIFKKKQVFWPEKIAYWSNKLQMTIVKSNGDLARLLREAWKFFWSADEQLF